MPFALEHTVTIARPEGFDSLSRANHLEDTVAPWGMEFIVGERPGGSKELQAIKADATEWGAARLRAWLDDHKIEGEIEWASDEPARMADVPSIRWQEDPNRTFRVLGVPIFELGRHKGFTYDSGWAERALRTFEDDAKRGRRPAVIPVSYTHLRAHET